MPAGGDNYLLRGIFSHDYVDINAGDVSVAGEKPIFECEESATGNMQYGDTLRINNRNYVLRGFKPDGSGWITLILEDNEEK